MGRDRIRREIIAARDRLEPGERRKLSDRVINNLFALDEFVAADTIMFYADFKSEVATMAAIKKCLKIGKRVALPLTLPKERRLKPYLIEDPDRELLPGYYSIPEPNPDSARPVDPGEIDLVVVPGSVFDRHGGRLGYGGGFYDRFLANDAANAFRVAVAFELQVIDESLSLEPHDQPMHCLVTEKGVFRFKRT